MRAGLIRHELEEGDAGDLATQRVERRERDGLRRLVDDEVHAGRGLQGADVASLLADDPALHLLRGDRHAGLRQLHGRVRRAPLDRLRHDPSRPAPCLLLRVLLHLPDPAPGFLARGRLDAGDELGTRLLGREPPDPLKLPNVASLDRFRLGEARGSLLLKG
jgi:hypothetical protein